VRLTFPAPLARQPAISAAHGSRAKVDQRFRPLIRVTFADQGTAKLQPDLHGQMSKPDSEAEVADKTRARR
jgi:hypothetical protein